MYKKQKQNVRINNKNMKEYYKYIYEKHNYRMEEKYQNNMKKILEKQIQEKYI